MKKKLLLLFMMTTVMLSGAKADGNYFDANGGYFGPTTETTSYPGAYYTGNYVSPFKAYLGKTDEDIQTKLDALWNHYFKGDDNSKVYYENGTEAYIKDINNNDVRSEGMSYGMMICVQTNHKAEFDKLWEFAKSHMWHNPSYSGDGYFSWHCETNGETNEQGCCPDAEVYFMMSLLFAANRWGDASYMEDAQAILKACWKGNEGSLFNEQSYIITFQPTNGNNSWSDPSYDLPSFVDLFARWSTTNNSKWSQAASATRNHLYKSSNTSSGLFSDYNHFDGTPKTVSYNSNSTKYMYDAMRCAMNFGMDYYLFGADAERQTEMAKRIIDFFEKDEYKHARFNWDGSNASESYTLGEAGCNAVACYALIGEEGYHEKIVRNLQMAWNGQLMTGQYRYYDGIVHYLAMLHLCGAFKIWKPRLVLNETDGVTPLTNAPWKSAAEIPSSFTRTFTAGVPSTVCLPFPVDATRAATAGKFYTFAGVNKTSDNWEVVMQESAPSNLVSGALAANTPYLFIPAATGEVTFFGMIPNTVGAETSSNIDGWTFIGTYDKRQWDDSNHTAEIGSVYGFAAQAGTSTGGKAVEAGQFFRVAGGENSYVVPFRAYLKYTGGGSARMRAAADNLPKTMTVRLINADGTETGISHALRQENQMNNNVWYSINGMKFDKQPTAKGFYLHNGKKVVIK